MDRILPASDRETAAALQKSLKKQGLDFHFNVKAEAAEVRDGKVQVTYAPKDGGEGQSVVVDKVMVAVGRRPYTDDLGLDTVGLATNERGFLTVDEHYKTGVDGVYAIGDVIGRIMLAHNAEEEGVACVEMLAGMAGHVGYDKCPAVVYTHPELASTSANSSSTLARSVLPANALANSPTSSLNQSHVPGVPRARSLAS